MNGAARRVALVVEYEGTDYAGFQSQLGSPTIQDKLETAIGKATGVRSRTRGASRTDAGAHATAQVVDFISHSRLSPSTLAAALNFYLPHSIRVTSASDVPLEFHSRFDASYREYRTTSSIGRSHPPCCVGRITWRPRLSIWNAPEKLRPACWASGISAEYRRAIRLNAVRYGKSSGGI